MSKIKSTVPKGSIFYCSVNELSLEMNYIVNYEFCRNNFTSKFASFSGWYKDFCSQKFDSIKDTGNCFRDNFYDIVSYVNINTNLAIFLAWGTKKFVGIWYQTGCCWCVTNKVWIITFLEEFLFYSKTVF